MSWWLPLKASTFAGEIDGLFTAVLIITGIAFVVVEIGLVWFSVKYRNRPGRTASCFKRNTGTKNEWITSSDVRITTTLRFTGTWSWLRIV
jgi:heme/copper-type cytochrome/quinol oxidase subunit 2